MMNQPFRQASNSPAGRHAAEAAKEARESFRSAADSVSDTVSDYASDAANKASEIASHLARRANKRYGRARDAAVETYDELHDRAEEYPYVTLGLAVAVGFVLGVLLRRRWSPDDYASVGNRARSPHENKNLPRL